MNAIDDILSSAFKRLVIILPDFLQLSVYSVFILLFILVNLRKEYRMLDLKVKIFKYMIFTVLLCVLLDILMATLEGSSFFFTRFILIYGNAIQFALTCLIVFLWYLYNEQYIFKNLDHFKKWLPLTILPFLFNIILSLLSPWFGFFYTITSDNMYIRGDLFYLATITTYFYAILTAFLIHNNRYKMRNSDYGPLMFFILPPALAGLFQTLNYGVLLIGPSLTFSFLVAYVHIQSKNMELDYLTGLYTRKELEYYIDMLSKRKISKKQYGGMMIDIDNFKSINDVYGHDTGDKVLRAVSDGFISCFRNTDFVARVGGDEFVAICEIQSFADLEIIVKRIRTQIDLINSIYHFPFTINLSIGYDHWDTKNIVKDEFMILIDKKMYLEKDAKKAIRE
jgi:diguanylate cyclase (GGDEF)-like protein